jgi:KipI family sensor histidine kinase inhibitor
MEQDDIGLDVREYGDSGLLVAVRGGSYASRWRHAQGLAQALRQSRTSGIEDVVGTYEDVFVAFDPVHTDHAAVEAVVRTVAGTVDEDAVAGMGGRTFEIPVLYGDDAGPDLSSVAAEVGVSPSELVRRHTDSAWTVRFVAAPTGTPFADRVDEADWEHGVARLASPRTAVPPGSVALSGQQCIVYPQRSPGGWRLIGRTPLRLVDPASDPLVPYGPGDRLVFVAIEEQRFTELSDEALTCVDGA